MKVLIIYAHPKKDSFNHAVLERTKGLLAELQQEVRIRDLYSLNFNPLFSAEDQQLLAKGEIPEDIKTEQEHIAWADYLIIIHPIWWFGMPAVMKGYIDRVLQAGFAYQYEQGQVKGLLQGKKLILINTTGTPQKIMQQRAIDKVLEATMVKGIYEFCGLQVEQLFLTGVPYVKKSDRLKYLDDVESLLWQEFD